MKKRFFTLFTLCLAFSAMAQRVQVGDLYYKLNSSDNTAEVTSKSARPTNNSYPNLTSVIIPETIDYNGNTYSVMSIGYHAFYGCTSLNSVTIPNSVTSIGGVAFHSCSGLTSVTIGNSVTSIGYHAFYGCSSLPVENNLRYADTYLVEAVDKTLSTYSIKEGTKWIGDEAFIDCSSLTSITIPSSVTSVGDDAFAYCSSLTAVTIPDSVTSIGNYAFFRCSSLTAVTIPNSVTSIGDCAFSSCSSLKNSIYNAHVFAYLHTSYAGAYTVPEGIESIAGCAFRYCSRLTSITIPNSVTSIGKWAFSHCSSLTSITIPNSVTSIGDEAFADCSGLTSINVDKSNSKYDSRNNSNAIIETTANTLITGCKNTIIPNSVTSIGDDAFAGCSGLTSITIPNNVTSIGYFAFIGCLSLDTIINLAMTPPALGINVFDGCDNPTLFVPCAALSDYQLHEQWRQFTTIECISSEETDTEDVIIESGTTTIIITWPTEEGADTYTIVIKKDGEVVCTLTFNSEGQLISIAFAPGRDGNHPAQYAEAVANGKGFRFTVTGLEDGTDYTYDITVKNEANQVIKTHSGKFTTEPYSAVDNTYSQSSNTNCQKLFRNGQLIILRDGVEYNAMGAEIR